MKIEIQPTLFPVTEPSDDHSFEKPYWERGLLVAGTDEAGRGCLAGPVVAAAVVLPANLRIDGVTDSKQLSAARRHELALQIKEEAMVWSVAHCSPSEIDALNILWASMEAMRRSIEALDKQPSFVFVDGNTSIPGLDIPSKSIVKGDSKSHSIAAASILAKTHRDELMKALHVKHPEYGWDTNVGYPTAAHYDALRQFGPTPHHRTSFRLV